MHIFDKPTQPTSLMHNLFARAQSQFLSVAGRNCEFKGAPKLAIIDQR